MKRPTTLPPLAFQGGSVARYLGRDGKQHRWLLRLPAQHPGADGAPEIEISAEDGADGFRLLATLLFGGIGLEADPPNRLGLSSLLVAAASDASWKLQLDRQRPVQITAEARAQMREAAGTVEAAGTWRLPAEAALSAAKDQLLIPSVGHYAALQEALAKGSFASVTGSRFPRAQLEKGGVRGHAELRQITPDEELLLPPEEAEALAQLMWRQREELSDRHADALDAISALWLRDARTALDRIPIYVDEILGMRGLKSKRGGAGRRGGYEPEQRADVFRALLHLQDVWLEIAEVTVFEDRGLRKKPKPTKRTLQSRAFVMTDRVGQRRLDGTMDVEAVLITPGTAFGRFLFGPGRQVALLSANALRYHPINQKPEKRLVRYLSWQWRIGAGRADFVRHFRVKTLIDELGLEGDSHEPQRLRTRLERCLDTLQENGDLDAWSYGEDFQEDSLPRKGWLAAWLRTQVRLVAPRAVRDLYRRLDRSDTAKPTPEQLPTKGLTWPELLRAHRQKLGLSQDEAANELDISQAYLSLIEAGRKAPSSRLILRLRAWIGET